jgi:hypothetical protein
VIHFVISREDRKPGERRLPSTIRTIDLASIGFPVPVSKPAR